LHGVFTLALLAAPNLKYTTKGKYIHCKITYLQTFL
jgi:hypothetical protein